MLVHDEDEQFWLTRHL